MPSDIGTAGGFGDPPAGSGGKIGVCILSAGIARRLEPISAIIAKPAFPLGGRVPIVEPWISRFVEAGMGRMAMNLHRVPESIRGYFGDGSRFGADIVYVHEEVPSGTLGGAIKMVRALRSKGFYPQRVFIPSGDIVSGIGIEQLQEMVDRHTENGAAFTVMLAPIPWQRRKDYGTVVLEGKEPNKDIPPGTYARIEQFIEKVADSPSNENNASNYLVETELLLEMEPYLTEAAVGLKEPCYDFGKHMLSGITGKVSHLEFLKRRKKDLYGYEPGRIWFDVGQKRDYLEVDRAVLSGDMPLDLPYEKVEWGWMGDGVDADLGRVKIVPPVVIGNGCALAPGAQLGPNVALSDGWVVGREARIKESILWPYFDGVDSPVGRAREVAEGVSIESAIVAGGRVTRDVRESTAHPLPDGELSVISIDWIPGGERA